jgi:ribonucleoside-diphosphate reductase beta chain
MDELVHLNLFQKIIPEYINQTETTNYQNIIYEMMSSAVEQEIKWSNHIIGNKILGMNEESTDIHTKYLANIRLGALGLDLKPLYPEAKYKVNPYQHLQKMSDTEGKGEVKANFFETGVTAYSMSSAVSGWDF